MKGYPSAPVHQCGDCRYFILHYYKFTEHTYHPLHYGHCTFPLCGDLSPLDRKRGGLRLRKALPCAKTAPVPRHRCCSNV